MNIKSKKLAQVPVIAIIAMSPAMMNAKTPLTVMPMDEEAMTEVFEQAQEEVNDAKYVMPPQATQQNYPLGVAYLSNFKIQQIKPAIGNGVRANLVLTKHYNVTSVNDVNEVYYIKHSFKSNNVRQEPPRVKELIYHNLGKDKEYLGIYIEEPIYKDNIEKGWMYSEVKLDDESAQFLLDLNAKATKWNDKTGIKFTETTNPNVRPPDVYKF